MMLEQTEIEEKLRHLFLPVFGLHDIDELLPKDSLVKVIGADSLDFVEMMFIIEKEFGFGLSMEEMLVSTSHETQPMTLETLFEGGKLTIEGAALLNTLSQQTDKYQAGMTRQRLLETITISDLAESIAHKFQTIKKTTHA